MKKFSILILLAVVAILILSACTSAKAEPEPVEFTIKMHEYAFTPSSIEVEVGQLVTLNLVNEGTLEHEIMFGRQVKYENNRPNGYSVDMFMNGGVHPEINTTSAMPEDEHSMEGHGGYMAYLGKTGDSGTITFEVTEEMLGEWEMGCFELEGVHYDQGMHGTFIVSQ